jgi:NitT/TauT family transport system ATP-binding protein
MIRAKDGSGNRTTAARPVAAAPATDVVMRGVSKWYDTVQVIDRLDLSIPAHRRVALVGPSGCGKSTVLRLIAGLEQPDVGEVAVHGQTTAAGRLANCALMPQRDLLLPWRSALDNAALALENRGVNRSQARHRVRPMFERFGLAGFEQRRPVELSGGMRQRVAFVRTLVADKDVLLLDEPFGALDSITRADLQQWLRDAFALEPRTVVLVTHDVEEALLLCQEVIVMSARPGRLVAHLPVSVPASASRREVIGTGKFIALRSAVMEALGQS